MQTRERTATRQRLRRKCDGRTTGIGAATPDIVCVVVTYQGATPFDALDRRVAEAMSKATVHRLKDGTYQAETPSIPCFYSDGATRGEALRELREDARWLLADPVRMSFSVDGKEYVAEVKAERHGGYSASVPALPGCFTCADTMEEIRGYLVEAARGWLDTMADMKAGRA